MSEIKTEYAFTADGVSIGVNDFVKRQTAESEFTHYKPGQDRSHWQEIVSHVAHYFDKAKPGYRDGVCLVPMSRHESRLFACGIAVLQEGDRLVGEYKARREGEEPRKTVRLDRGSVYNRDGWVGKTDCVAVDIVLYRKDVLEEGGEDCTGCDWDIISINGRLTEAEMPIHPNTLIANHFQLDGGTSTGMTPEEFESALRESVLFWKNKAMIQAHTP